MISLATVFIFSLVSTLFVFLFSRIISLYFEDYYQRLLNKKKHLNFESILNSKIFELRGKKLTTSRSMEKQEKYTHNKIEKKYLNERESIEKENETQSLDKCLDLFEQARGGKGEIIKGLSSFYEKKIRTKVTPARVCHAVNELILGHTFLFTENKNGLMSFNEIKTSLISKIIFEIIFDEVTFKRYHLLNRIHSDTETIITCLEILTFKKLGGDEKGLFSEAISGNLSKRFKSLTPLMKRRAIDGLIKKGGSIEFLDEKGIYNIFIEVFKKYQTFQKKKQRKSKGQKKERSKKKRANKNLAWACQVLKIREIDDYNIVKKSYNKLMLKYHPDRHDPLLNQKEKEESSKKLHEAQEAFEIMKKSLKIGS